MEVRDAKQSRMGGENESWRLSGFWNVLLAHHDGSCGSRYVRSGAHARRPVTRANSRGSQRKPCFRASTSLHCRCSAMIEAGDPLRTVMHLTAEGLAITLLVGI